LEKDRAVGRGKKEEKKDKKGKKRKGPHKKE